VTDVLPSGPHDTVTVSGPEAETFLQGQLSQDVARLGERSSVPTLLLEPDGKLGYRLLVTRTGSEAFALTVEAPYGADVLARLERFKLRTRCDLVLEAADPASEVDPEAELRRIEAGIPRMGAELKPGVIPEEAGVVASAVDFDKGCYVGQELVARIDSRGGNVPRRLRRLVFAGDPTPGAGAGALVDRELLVGGEVVGVVTSVAAWPDGTATGLGYVKRAVDPPAEAIVRGGDGELPVRVEALAAREEP
jgi:folate-binding protein YgfZ